MSERAKQVLRYFNEQQDFLRARTNAGIELYRKGGAYIRVTDADGNPVPNTVIEADEVKSAFKFGANTFMLDGMETDEKNALYKEKFAGLFNLGTVPFYWIDLEPEQDKLRYTADSPRIYRRPAPDICIDYCLKNGIEPKLHCLNYTQQSPAWANRRSAMEYKQLLIKRFREIGERYAHLIPMIEVTNETYLLSPNANDFFFDDDFCEWSFREAQKYFPANELIINEAGYLWEANNAHTNRNPYYQQIEKLLNRNVPVHGIGMQFHSFCSLDHAIDHFAKPLGRYSPEYMFAIMDKMSELNLPLQITEMTIPAYSDDAEDEEVQAELLRSIYSMFFAQKNMEAIIYWNLPNGYGYLAEPGDMTRGENVYYGGLLHFDMSEKPAYKALKKLIREEWMTHTRITTDADGRAYLRGFHGDYELKVHAGDNVQSRSITIGSGMAKFHNITV